MNIPNDAELVALTDELHRRLHVQARNLLLEYRMPSTSFPQGRRAVPYDVAEKSMILYGNLIARDIFEKLKEEIQVSDSAVIEGGSAAFEEYWITEWHRSPCVSDAVILTREDVEDGPYKERGVPKDSIHVIEKAAFDHLAHMYATLLKAYTKLAEDTRKI